LTKLSFRAGLTGRWRWIKHSCEGGFNSKAKVDETVIFRWITHKCEGGLNSLIEMD
jgi:hypothetical protein